MTTIPTTKTSFFQGVVKGVAAPATAIASLLGIQNVTAPVDPLDYMTVGNYKDDIKNIKEDFRKGIIRETNEKKGYSSNQGKSF